MKHNRTVVRVAQHATGVDVDGVVGPKTIAACRDYDLQHPEFESAGSSSGLVVMVAQHAAGLRGKSIDGVVGPMTRDACREYLAQHKVNQGSKRKRSTRSGWAEYQKLSYHPRDMTVSSLACTTRTVEVYDNEITVDLATPDVVHVPDTQVPPIARGERARNRALGNPYKGKLQNRCPEVLGLPGRFNKGDGRLYAFHRALTSQLRLAMALCEALGVVDEIYRLGSYNHRHMRHDPSAKLSTHSWGCALDINPADNSGWKGRKARNAAPWSDAWWGRYPAGVSQVLVACFRKAGFAWGGDWRSFRDPMHFEYVQPYRPVPWFV